MNVTADQVRAFRLRRQYVALRDGTDPTAIARRLVGVQAQVPSAAAQAVAVRTPAGTADDGAVDAALAAGTLIRTWSLRGTLHLLAADQAPAVLALLAAARTWDKGSWQREFATAAQMAALEEAVARGARRRRPDPRGARRGPRRPTAGRRAWPRRSAPAGARCSSRWPGRGCSATARPPGRA